MGLTPEAQALAGADFLVRWLKQKCGRDRSDGMREGWPRRRSGGSCGGRGRTVGAGMRAWGWTRRDVDLLLLLRIERLSTGVHFGSSSVPTRIGGREGAREVEVSRGRGDHGWKVQFGPLPLWYALVNSADCVWHQQLEGRRGLTERDVNRTAGWEMGRVGPGVVVQGDES